jgi:hypothetical protein
MKVKLPFHKFGKGIAVALAFGGIFYEPRNDSRV